MPKQVKPSPPEAPDPSNSYERAHPERESQGRLEPLPDKLGEHDDEVGKGAPNRKAPERQVNAGQ